MIMKNRLLLGVFLVLTLSVQAGPQPQYESVSVHETLSVVPFLGSRLYAKPDVHSESLYRFKHDDRFRVDEIIGSFAFGEVLGTNPPQSGYAHLSHLVKNEALRELVNKVLRDQGDQIARVHDPIPRAGQRDDSRPTPSTKTPTASAWKRDCLSGSCRVFQYVDIELGSSSEPARILLEVTSSDEVILTALNTRTYHERFYTTKPRTYAEFGRRDYVPIRTFFHENNSPGRIVVDGNQVAVLPIRNESQLKARASDERDIIRSFVAGTSARVYFSSFVYGRQRATFSLLGFTRNYNSLNPSHSPSGATTTQPVVPVSVLSPFLKGNGFRIGPEDLETKKNPHGSGTFVYAPRTRYSGTEQLFVWFVKGESALKLNGATHNLTPSLPFPRDADLGFWEGTGLSAHTATATGLKLAFGK